MATPTVFITVPKYVAITPIPAPSSVASGATIVTPITTTPSSSSSTTTNTSTLLAKIKPAPAPQQIHSPAISMVSDNDCCSDSSSTATPNPPRGKKRRLDHLTWEEKIQRKKLKNRVAAQTSRDRKKARMEEMESEIKELTARTQILVNKCESLQAINDSLLEKNQKLDMEVETLRQQLQDIQNKQQQQQQHSNLINTCAGSGLTTQGLSVDTGAKQQQQCVEAPATVEKEHNRLITVADNSSLPTLQDMLLPPEFSEIVEGTLDDAEFDAGKLEELAESLLADITADLEAGDRAGNASVAEITGGTERLPGSVVGTTAECLESGEHTGQNGSGLSRETITTSTPLYVTSLPTAGQLGLENKLENGAATSSITTQTLTATQDATATNNNNNNNNPNITPDTVYGTYDAKTNSITVVMDDVAVPVNEVVEEIYWDGGNTNNGSTSSSAAAEDDDVDMIYTSASPSGIASPSQVFLNVTSCSDDEATTATHDDDGDDEDFNFDPIAKFLCPKRPLVSPLAKSPASSYHSATSDHGYESILGSPPSSSHYEPLSEDLPTEFSDWPPGFNELFPTLI